MKKKTSQGRLTTTTKSPKALERSKKNFLSIVIPSLVSKNKELAFIGIMAFLLLTFFSIISYPQYDFWNQYLSDLGVGNTASYFNTGIIFCSIFLLPLFVSLYKPNSFLMQTACFLGIASMIFFLGVAAFPQDSGIIHEYAAGLFFFCIMLTIAFVALDYAKSFLKKTNVGKEKISSFVTLLFLVLSLLVCAIILIFLYLRTPFWQKLSVLGLIFWTLIFAYSLKR